VFVAVGLVFVFSTKGKQNILLHFVFFCWQLHLFLPPSTSLFSAFLSFGLWPQATAVCVYFM